MERRHVEIGYVANEIDHEKDTIGKCLPSYAGSVWLMKSGESKYSSA